MKGIETVQAKPLSQWYKRQEADTLNDEQVKTVTNDLKRLWNMYSPLLRGVRMKNAAMNEKGGLLTPMFIINEHFVCFTEDAPQHGIDGETYWHYKAISNILSHVMMWESFTFSGQKKAWKHIDGILYHISSKAITQEFVRNDILYKGAVKEYNSNLQRTAYIPSNKLILGTYKTFEVKQ